MKPFKDLQNTLKDVNLALVSKELGYKSEQRGANSLDKFLKTKNLSNWIDNGFYDFKFTSLNFYKTLAKLFDASDEEIEQDLKEAKIYKKEYDSFVHSYIFVNTNFRRKNEPILVLSILESKRRLLLKIENLMFRSDEDILKKVGTIIRRHYRLKKGTLPVWGDIKNYQYHHKDDKTYLFDIYGNYIPNDGVCESLATIGLK
jgi:hypothetical protein